MSEKKLSETIGADEAAVESLARANIRTLRDLTAADAESAAMASGIPAERIREWQQRARRAGAKQGMGPVAKGWLVGAIGVAIALLLGWALMTIGSGRIRQAEQLKVAYESKLNMALSAMAVDAIDELRQARLAMHNKNWGSAQVLLFGMGQTVESMRAIAPDDKKGEVSAAAEQLVELQKAAEDQSKDVMERVDRLEAALAAMTQPAGD